MYLPYLRGKQFELIALREIADLMAKVPQKVSPIIEPVKDSSTFKSALRDLASKKINFTIIVNPTVGDFTKSSDMIINTLKDELGNYIDYQVGVIVDDRQEDVTHLEKIKAHGLNFKGLTLIHNIVLPNPKEVIDAYEKYFSIVNNVVSFSKTNRRYYRNFPLETVVSLEDFFKVQVKNKDYLEVDESPFSEEHLFFKKDGIKGFSDFLTIGDNYTETGFIPYAVAIHLSFADAEKKIRIKHFVSDSNEDQTDVAGKFAEALRKLIVWCDENKVDSKAVHEFRELYNTGHFPGLGSIKKLSIMHHIELVINLI